MQYDLKIIWKILAIAARNVMGTITHVATEDSIAALTFDDGPHPDYTPRLLDILRQYRAQATFFMVGEAASKYPDLVRQVAQEGHTIGNHSWDHPTFSLIKGHERREQIRACQQAISVYGGKRLFRPPYGAQSRMSRLDALWLGYEVIGWSVEVGDWCEPSPSLIADNLVERIHPGSIILLHDALFDEEKLKRCPVDQEAVVSRESMLIALRVFFERVGERFRFVTIPQLLLSGQPQHQNWYG